MLAEGRSEGEIRDFYRETYLTSDGKIDLALDVAKREERILRGRRKMSVGSTSTCRFVPQMLLLLIFVPPVLPNSADG